MVARRDLRAVPPGAGDMVVDCEEEYLLLGPLGASLLDGNKE